jgi:hypothetical protein
MQVLAHRKAGRFMNKLSSLAVVLLAITGCVKATYPVEGEVRVDGIPLADGNISFFPDKETGGPSEGTKIQGGKYSLAKGLKVGKYRIEIHGARTLPHKVPDPYIPAVLTEQVVEVVPPEYNRASNKFVEVRAGPNTFDFDIKTGK